MNSTGSKKNQVFSLEQKRSLIDPHEQSLSIRRQCELLGLSRASFYYQPRPETEENLLLMRLLDQLYLRRPYYGVERMTDWLQHQGYQVGPKRIRRLMRLMNLEAIYPKPRISAPGPGHQIYPYLLRDVKIVRVNQVWSTDITYIPLMGGFVYLVAIIDWFSRYVLSWEISTTMEIDFCLSTLERALRRGRPEIFNTDQGSQFTSSLFTGVLKKNDVAISMDGRGRALDNVLIERLWRSVKYEDIYLHNYETVPQVIRGVGRYFNFYNGERRHTSLKRRTPESVWLAAC